MSEGKLFLLLIIVINVGVFLAIIINQTLLFLAAFAVGLNILLLPHLNKYIKD